MSIFGTDRVLSVRHWNDTLFSFKTTCRLCDRTGLRRKMKISLMVLVVGLGASVSQSAWSQGWGYGRQNEGGRGGWNKLEMCQGCHDMARGGMGMGMHMGSGETAPKLSGQHTAYLEKSLKAYRSRVRRHPVMNRMASMLTDRDIADIARFYATKGGK